MTVGRILCFVSALPMLAHLHAATTEDASTSVNCQFTKPSRKQVEAEPLNGMCLRDVVTRLAKKLEAITDTELGISLFQDKLDKMEFVNISNNLDVRLNTLVEDLNAKLMSHVDLLQQSNKIIESILSRKQNYNNYSSQAARLDENKDSNICTYIVSALTTNIRSQGWKNLHILPIDRPGTMCGAPSLAHNVGPLLLAQSCPRKNVILLLEHGKFMSEGDIALAQITAKTIIDMLTDTDYVTAIGLAGQGSIHCRNSLVRASDINKFQLARHIDNMIRTDSNRSLDVDFKTLTQSVESEVVVIHLTNTLTDMSNVKHIVDSISSDGLHTHLKTILILSDQETHRNINRMSTHNESVIILPTQNVLGYEIARLFSGLKCSHKNIKNYYLSDPYFEPYSKAMTLSIGQITDTALLSLDVKLRDFLDEVTYMNAGPNVYPILFDAKEIVWMHRDFPRMEVVMEQPLKVYLRNIENINNETVTTMINEAQGVVDVVTRLGEKKQYRWKHLVYKDLIVCLVSTRNESLLTVTRVVPSLPTDILHHRLDLMLQNIVNKDSLCIYQNKIMSLSTGVIYLSPWCFQSPIEQLKLLETGSAVTVQSYMAYIKDLTGLLANPGLHQSVRPDVATLAQTLQHFKKQHKHSSLNKFIIRRYIVGTVSGVLEIFPGMVLDSGLDPKRRAWYKRALEHTGKVVLTSPYLDSGGSGYVVTISRAVKRSADKLTNSEATAVISMDVTMGYVARLLLEMFPFCNETTVKCFLMDEKGYLVSHPALFDSMGKVELQHLTQKELLVANDILNHEFFVKKKFCASHLDGTIQRYYQFNTSLNEVLTNIVHGEHCTKYQVASVPGTNVFLGVVNITCNKIPAFCPCSTMDRLCLNCKRMEQTECECPCECSLYSPSCVHDIINDLKPCPAPYEQGTSLQIPWIQHANVKACPTLDCKTFETEAACLGIVGCQWCYLDSDGETPLNAPYCSDMSLCFKGIFGSSVPYSDGTYNSQSTEEIVVRDWPSCGPVAGGILAFVLILGTTLFCYRLRSVHSGVEHQCLHLHASPDTLRMTHLDGDPEPMELDQTKNNLNSLLRDGIAPISPYRVSTNYRKPPGGDSDHGYSTMTPHDDSEQQTFADPLLNVNKSVEPDLTMQSVRYPSPTTHLESPHHVLVPVTVHRNMETNYC